MAGIFKHFLLITLAAICFLPKDGVCADVYCYSCEGNQAGPPKCDGETDGGSRVITRCSTGKCSVFVMERSVPDDQGFTSKIRKRCGLEDEMNGCIPTTEAFGGKGTLCTCSTESCNSNLEAAGFKGSGSCRLLGWLSSVLISVFVTVISTPFLLRP